MAEVFRGESQRSAELAGYLHVIGPATRRLLHPRLFGALRWGAGSDDRLARSFQRSLWPFEDAGRRRFHSGRGDEAAMDRGIQTWAHPVRLRRSQEGRGYVAIARADALPGRAGWFLIRRHLSPCLQAGKTPINWLRWLWGGIILPGVSDSDCTQSIAGFSNSQEGRACKLSEHCHSVRKEQRSSSVIRYDGSILFLRNCPTDGRAN